MTNKLTVVAPPWGRGVLDSETDKAPSSSRRPYSPYPYRDLPRTPSEWETPTRRRTPRPTPHAQHRQFRLFSYLPAELRLQVWREAMISACEHARVLRIRLTVTDTPRSDGDGNLEIGRELEIHPTPQLAESTSATRSLLSTCSEARREALRSPTWLPNVLPLAGGGILRCDLARDILLLSDVSSDLLLSLSNLTCDLRSSLAPYLAPARHLGLDSAPLLETTSSSSYPAGTIPPEIATALVTLTASFPRLEQVYLLQETAAIEITDDGNDGAETVPVPRQHLFLGPDSSPAMTTSTTHPGPFPEHAPSQIWERENGREVEWYTTRPFQSYRVTHSYFRHLTRLMRFLCQFRQALDAPPVLTEQMEDAGIVERLEKVRIRVLGHYVAGSPQLAAEGGAGGDDAEEMQADQQQEEWLLSSPERCLEVALGSEPRWVQWEWVCQCLEA